MGGVKLFDTKDRSRRGLITPTRTSAPAGNVFCTVNSIWAGPSRCCSVKACQIRAKPRRGKMAVARDSTYDTLKRAPSYSGSYTVSLSGDSTISLEDLGSVDIGTLYVYIYKYKHRLMNSKLGSL